MTRVTETRDVKGFDAVELRGSGTVTIVQGDLEGLTVEADEKTMPEIETVVVDRVLRLGFKSHWGFMRHPGPIAFNVSARDVRELGISGSGDIRSAQIASKDLELKISGSGEINLEHVVAGRVESRISGSGDIVVIGDADSVQARISGSGTMRADRLACRGAEVWVSGSGDAYVQASDELDVRVSGSGNVRYAGNPRLNTKVSGSGRVTQIDMN